MPWRALALLWLFGICLRLTVLAVPPAIPLIHQSLHLTQAQVGALMALPLLLFSFAAIPGAALIGRHGAFAVLLAGIVVTGVGSALRGAAGDVTMLFAATFAMGAGIAIMQPAMPSLVRQWVPLRIGLGTAVYTNGLLVGEALGASLTLPVMLPLVGGDWRWAFVGWSVPVLAIALAGWALRPAPMPMRDGPPPSAWPDWRSPLTWKLGLISGGSSSLYFTTNAFLPDYLHHLGRPELLTPALAWNNWLQVPASLLLLAFSGRLMLRRWPIVAAGLLFTAAAVGVMVSRGEAIVAWSGLVGFCSAFVLTLTLALPPLLVPPQHVPRVSAAMFLVGYLCAIVTPVAGGALWDLSGIAWLAFAPAGLFGAVIVACALGLEMRPAQGNDAPGSGS